jgi:hypothetical protein
MNGIPDVFAGPQSGRYQVTTMEAQFAAETRRAEERSRWLNDLRVKVREGRWNDLTPAERGWIEAAIVSGV